MQGGGDVAITAPHRHDRVHAGLVLAIRSVPEAASTVVTIGGNARQKGGRMGFEACCQVRTTPGANYALIRLG
jgi:hypothetical protein